jgi:hypothetical protein
MARAPAPDELSSDQRTFLLYGPDDRCGHAFNTEAEVEAAWQRHRETLLAACPAGRRAWGWRIFDRPEIRWVDYQHERAINWRAGVLSAAERIELEAMWYRDFTRSQDLSAIPYELRRRWKMERRQQNRKERPPGTIAEEAESA